MTQFSPGIVIREFDFSDYAERQSSAILGIVGTATKGPKNSATLITNERELIDTFGYPITAYDNVNKYYYNKGLILPALHYLRQGNQLVVVRVNGSTAASTILETDNDNALTVTAISPGSWVTSEDLQIQIMDATVPNTGGTNFKLVVRHMGAIKETFDDLVNVAGDDNHPETRINGNSFFISVTSVADLRPDNVASSVLGTFSGYTNAAGADGTTTASSYYDSANAAVGARLFEDADLVDVNIIALPSVAGDLSAEDARGVYGNVLTMAESRADVLVLIDPTVDLDTVTEIRNYTNGTGYTNSNAFNSSYGAVYWPWLLVYDSYTKQNVWVQPSGFVAGQMSFTDRVSEPWFATAGYARGRIQNALAVKYNASVADRNILYAPGQCVNSIVNFSGQGITVWGQKTTQRKDTALNRVNVRRMLNYAKKIVARSSKQLIFEPNDSRTWRRFTQLVEPVIEQIKQRRGLYDFRVICDASTNPSLTVDRNEMYGKILLKPTKTAEVITVDFTLLSTGANFSEFLA